MCVNHVGIETEKLIVILLLIPAANLMLSVPGAIDAILDIKIKGLVTRRYTEMSHQSPM